MPKAKGRLIVIGGEQKKAPPDPELMAKVAFHAGGVKGRIVVIAADSGPGGRGAASYRRALLSAGATSVTALTLKNRAHAEDPKAVAEVDAATGVFLAGDDPDRLVDLLAGTPLAKAIRDAFRRGACIAGTSAGASVLSERVVAEGATDIHPRVGLIKLEPGLGLFDRIVIDHHYCEKQRLGRLVTIAATAPGMLGVGVDAGTALVVDPAKGIEVVGQGAVTVFDGRTLSYSNMKAASEGQILALCNVGMNLLPSGFSFKIRRGGEGVLPGGYRVAPSLQAMIEALASTR